MNLTIGQIVFFDEHLSRRLNGAKHGIIRSFGVGKIELVICASNIGSFWLDEEDKKHLLEQPLGVATEYEPYEYYGNPFGDGPTPDNPIPIDIQLGIKGKNLLDGTIVKLTGNEQIECYKQEMKREEEKKMDYQKLLKKWAELKKEAIKQTYKEESEKILSEDKVVQSFEATYDDLKAIVEEFYEIWTEVPRDTFTIARVSKKRIATKETSEKLAKLETAYYNDISILDETISEIYAAVAICQTEESLRKILKAYNVIDKYGKISVK